MEEPLSSYGLRVKFVEYKSKAPVGPSNDVYYAIIMFQIKGGLHSWVRVKHNFFFFFARMDGWMYRVLINLVIHWLKQRQTQVIESFLIENNALPKVSHATLTSPLNMMLLENHEPKCNYLLETLKRRRMTNLRIYHPSMGNIYQCMWNYIYIYMWVHMKTYICIEYT